MRRMMKLGWKYSGAFEKTILTVLAVLMAINVVSSLVMREWVAAFVGLGPIVIIVLGLWCSGQRHIIDVYSKLAPAGYTVGRAIQDARKHGADEMILTWDGDQFFITYEVQQTVDTGEQ